jgi:hypothetical protein
MTKYGGNDERASNRYSSLGNTDALRRLLRTANKIAMFIEFCYMLRFSSKD